MEQRQAAKTRVENLLKDYTTSTRYQEVTLAMKGPSVVLNQSQLLKILSTFGDKCPQNGSKNVPISPKTNPGITLAWNEVTCCSGGAGGGAGARERGADAGPGRPESSHYRGTFPRLYSLPLPPAACDGEREGGRGGEREGGFGATSLIRNRHPPQDHHRALGIFLL